MSPTERERMLVLLSGFVVTQALATVARLRIADLVHERPRTAEELALATGADPDAVGRVLRALASLGVFAHADGVVHQTDLSELLREEAPGSIHGHAEMFATIHYRAWTEAGRSLQTGEPAFEHVFGMQLFDWLAEHPEGSELFNRSMAASATARQAALLARDWSDVATIVDVGGGTGTVLSSLLAQQPHLRGVVFDLPHLRDGAEATIALADPPRLARRRCRPDPGGLCHGLSAAIAPRARRGGAGARRRARLGEVPRPPHARAARRPRAERGRVAAAPRSRGIRARPVGPRCAADRSGAQVRPSRLARIGRGSPRKGLLHDGV